LGDAAEIYLTQEEEVWTEKVERQQKERYSRRVERERHSSLSLFSLCLVFWYTYRANRSARSLFTFNLITEAKERSKGSQEKPSRQLECFPLL